MSRTVPTVNPATGESLQTYDAAGIDDVIAIHEDVHTAQPGWAAVLVEQRADHLRAVGAQLRKQRDELTALMTAEMGKPVAEARAEVEKSATTCDYYAENGPAALASQTVGTGNQRSWVAYEPLGVVLAVMPWNFPYWQVLRFAAPPCWPGTPPS